MESEISQLKPGDSKGFQEMIAIYREAIEPSEQKTTDDLVGLISDGRYVFLVSRANDSVVGFAIMFFPPGGDFWLLEYMAVAATLRSLGLGARLFEAAKLAAGARTPAAPCLLEVDRPGAKVAPGNDPLRRLRFYRRMGCRAIAGLNYILPLDVSGTPPPMLLLVHGLDRSQQIPRGTVDEWLRSIYGQVYQCPHDDRRIADMVSPLPESIELKQL